MSKTTLQPQASCFCSIPPAATWSSRAPPAIHCRLRLLAPLPFHPGAALSWPCRWPADIDVTVAVHSVQRPQADGDHPELQPQHSPLLALLIRTLPDCRLQVTCHAEFVKLLQISVNQHGYRPPTARPRCISGLSSCWLLCHLSTAVRGSLPARATCQLAVPSSPLAWLQGTTS